MTADARLVSLIADALDAESEWLDTTDELAEFVADALAEHVVLKQPGICPICGHETP